LSSIIPDSSGIYRITCTTTGKFYIGSAINLRKRLYEHFRTLRLSTHSNSKMQHAFNKYGEQSFTHEIIELVLSPFLIDREQYWIDTLQAVKNGFNLSPTADSRLGYVFSPESREKMRQSHLGKPSNRIGYKASPETCERIGASKRGKPSTRIGYKASPETCAKVSASKRGKSNPHEGVPRTPEARAKIGAAGIGRTYSPETIEKVRAAKIGNTNGAKDYIITSPEGIEYSVHNLKAFCFQHGLTQQALSLVASGTRSHHKGWKARYLETA
jgi:group I intron endonuclease